MTAVHTERAFKEPVADHLVDRGYHRGDPANVDAEICLLLRPMC